MILEKAFPPGVNEKKGKLLLPAPDGICGTDTLLGNLEAMKQVYGKEIRNTEQIRDFLNQW